MNDFLNKQQILSDAFQHGNVLSLNLIYPPYPGDDPGDRVTTFQVGLMAVRAADDIRVSYDYDRDGWKIEQEKMVRWEGTYAGTGEWVEVAFVDAWGNEREVGEAEFFEICQARSV